jgi:lysophospholipase L1-like esterase
MRATRSAATWIAVLLLGGAGVGVVPAVLSAPTAAPVNQQVIVCFGDSITAAPYPSFLEERLAVQGLLGVTVANEGIGGNRILHDAESGTKYGPAGVKRFQGALEAHPGARTVIVLEGINDIIHPGVWAPMDESVSSAALISGLKRYIEVAHHHGLRIIGATILPFEGCCLKPGVGPPPDWAVRESKRHEINDWIRSSGAFDGVIDFDRLMQDPQNPHHLNPAYDKGDHLHPSADGYHAMADSIDLELLLK